MDEWLIDDDRLSLGRKSVLPGEGFFFPDSFEAEQAEAEARDILTDAGVVVIADPDADGLACTALIREAHGEGALLPLGGHTTGHKGYALSVVAELLGGLVGGNPVVGEADPEWLANGGAFVLVDPTAFLSVADIETRIEHLAAHLRREDGVRLPGEGAHRRAQDNRERGVAVPEHDLVPLAETAASVGVTPPAPIREALADADDVDDDVQTW